MVVVWSWSLSGPVTPEVTLVVFGHDKMPIKNN